MRSLTENTQVTEQDTTFTQAVLGAYMYTSAIIRVSIQILQDNAVDIEPYLPNILAERIGRATNAHLRPGTGTGQPGGVVTGVAGSSATPVTYGELVDLEYSADPDYRINGEWMLHDSTLTAIKKLKDTDGNPLWVSGAQVCCSVSLAPMLALS